MPRTGTDGRLFASDVCANFDLDLGSGHAYRRSSLVDLYLHAKFY